jgi:hypothetical protein
MMSTASAADPGGKMNVRVRVQFESLGQDELDSLRSLARGLTDSPESVNVFADETLGWLVAEFTMTTEAQSTAVPKISWEMRHWADNRIDSTISFPKTEEERARADRKAEKRRARRRRAK